MRTLQVFLLIILFAPVTCFSREPKNQEIRTYTTNRLSTAKPVIDGKLNDECWQTGKWDGGFVQWIPTEGAEPSKPTEVNIQYDDKNIYVAIRAFDDPDKISKRAGRRDELSGDMVGINFDSYHDHRTGFEFTVSAGGQKIDLILTNPMNGDFNWNAVWTGKTGLEDSAWVAEYEIPLSQLRYSNEPNQTWGMHVWRWIDRLGEESDWEPQSSTGPGMLYQFGHLEGIKDLPKSRRLELMPYSLGKVKTFEKQAGNPFTDDGNDWLGSIGLDAKVGLSSNFTADITINPDFGQVESDPSVMNLTAFETFYEEKRPFFLEGKNIFKYEFDDVNLFYTRRIGHAPTYHPSLNDGEYINYPENTSILSAVKISGKSSHGLSVGIMQSMTNKEQAEISSNGQSSRLFVEPLTSYTVARVQQDYNESTTVLGGMITSTNRFINDEKFNFLPSNSFTGGVDFLHQWNDKEFYLDARVIGSSVYGDEEAIKQLQLSSARYYQRPDAHRLNYDETMTGISGQGGRLRIGKGSKGLWRYSTGISWLSPGLELNDIGFMQTVDEITNSNEISYFINQPKGKFRQFSVGFEINNHWDYGFNYLFTHFNTRFYGEFLNKWSVNSHICHFTNALDTRILRGGNAMKIPSKTHGNIGFGTDNAKKASFSLHTFYEAGSENSSSSYSISPNFSYRPIGTLKLSMSIDYSDNQSELQYVTRVDDNQSPVYLLGNLDQQTLGATFRVDYNISPELSIQYYGSPFSSVGKYDEFKSVTNPIADDYNDRFELLSPQLQNDEYWVVGDNNSSYSFKNPDFQFAQFRSNMVFRWECKPGSQLYFIWSNERTNSGDASYRTLNKTMKSLNKAFPDNLFLVKLSYWFSA